MKWGINLKNYVQEDTICKYFGDKKCPCVCDKEIRKKYDVRNGPWAIGKALPECESCSQFEQIDPTDPINPSFHHTLVEGHISLEQYRENLKQEKEMKAERKAEKNTPIRVELLNVSGGTASERLSKMIIGGFFVGTVGALFGALGSNASNTKLTFKVDYYDGKSKIIVEKATSKKAKELLDMMSYLSDK